LQGLFYGGALILILLVAREGVLGVAARLLCALRSARAPGEPLPLRGTTQ
jgi:hypothetical protein